MARTVTTGQIGDGASGADGTTVGHPGQVLALDRDPPACPQDRFGTRQQRSVEDLQELVRDERPT